MNDIEKLQKWINESSNIVAFSGAGVSTESGIKDFRSKDGLYNQKYKYQPELILSHTFFLNIPQEFFKFYRDKLNVLDKDPNIIHNFLANLEKENKLKVIITQNIDNLHFKAGSKNVIELHGNIMRNYCSLCHKAYDANYIFNSKGVPKCSCGGIIKPDVVLYEESLQESDLNNAVDAIIHADLLLVLGTSLTVYPASGLLNYYQGHKMVIINQDITSFDKRADLVINKSLKEVFAKLKH